jgi:hypothetical protein
MGLGSPPARSASQNWERLDQLMEERSVDVALLNEAPIQGLAQRSAIYSDFGTVGWDLRRDNNRPKTRPGSAGVLAGNAAPPREIAPRAVGSHGRRPNVPFVTSKPGTWAAGQVDAPLIGLVTCVSLYGFMD